jgi:hypothetical protein
MEAVIKQYPHILNGIYLPDNYSAILLSGIVTSPNEAPITMELSVASNHLPNLTKDMNETYLLVAAGPNFAVNLIFGLLFVKAKSMITDFVNNFCQAKHLLCKPFPINFRRAMKSFPVVWGCNSASHSVKFHKIQKALSLLKAYFTHKEEGCPLHHLVPQSKDQGLQTTPPKKASFGSCWVPPIKSAEHTNDYLHQVLGDLGYL